MQQENDCGANLAVLFEVNSSPLQHFKGILGIHVSAENTHTLELYIGLGYILDIEMEIELPCTNPGWFVAVLIGKGEAQLDDLETVKSGD